MMHRTRSRTAAGAAALLLAGALAACSDAPTGSAPERTDPTLARQVAALGFRADMIEDHGDFVLVEGDIYLSRAQLRSVPVGSDDPLRPSFQYRTTNVVTSANVRDIVVDVSGLASEPGWQTAAREALTHWSGISNSNVKMVEGSPADITVATTCTSYNVAAYASFPTGGNVGPTIYVNTCFGYSTSHAQKVHNMVHELGHTLGFRHSNYVQNGEAAGTEGAVHVPNTPTSGNDGGSVMNSGTALNSWAGFSAADLSATRALYPLPVVSASVTNAGGQPLITWGALSGATHYSVKLIHSISVTSTNPWSSQTETDLGATTGTSLLDVGNFYTGASACFRTWPDRSSRVDTWEYAITAVFTNGASVVRIPAPVAPCGEDPLQSLGTDDGLAPDP